MQPVLDRPVQANLAEESFRVCFAGSRSARESVDPFGTGVGAVQVGDMALEAERDVCVGEVDVSLELVSQPDLADFDAAVALVDCAGLRGKKSPTRPFEYRRRAWVGCL